MSDRHVKMLRGMSIRRTTRQQRHIDRLIETYGPQEKGVLEFVSILLDNALTDIECAEKLLKGGRG